MRVLRIFGGLLGASILCAGPVNAGVQERVYKIAHGFPFPPWDVGPLEGVSIDVLRAVCDANAAMKCTFEVLPSQACFDTDADGNPVVGHDFASGQFDGCLTWFKTAVREQLGAEFGHGYSSGPLPQLIAREDNPTFDGLGSDGALGGAHVAFLAGFFNDAACLSIHYTDFTPVIYESDESGRAEMVTDLLSGFVDLAFWDNTNTVPDGAKLVGAAVRECGPGEMGLAVYPPSQSRKQKSDDLRRDYNCGLALIRANGVLEAMCKNSPHPGGDPNCLLDGPPPTVQCLADNPPSP